MVTWSGPVKPVLIFRKFDQIHVPTMFIFRWTFQHCCLLPLFTFEKDVLKKFAQKERFLFFYRFIERNMWIVDLLIFSGGRCCRYEPSFFFFCRKNLLLPLQHSPKRSCRRSGKNEFKNFGVIFFYMHYCKKTTFPLKENSSDVNIKSQKHYYKLLFPIVVFKKVTFCKKKNPNT